MRNAARPPVPPLYRPLRGSQRTANYYEEYEGLDRGITAREVIIVNEAPHFTGLVDAQGNDLYFYPEKVKMGYIK